ncbi:nuclear RNA export factor 1 [Drosophila guanche]|uniref:Blast:Nuclear RNA export factor 1 n=1 Tax=Drosophila guanche TaxID=7266 RepID=A0A3B0K9C7_DROGU|nr:nuclear RNA export factor 1 [Drosophila guanche]SPP89292.1 blast:Nuclear RNA export factor 1 [Drosophila guanche]
MPKRGGGGGVGGGSQRYNNNNIGNGGGGGGSRYSALKDFDADGDDQQRRKDRNKRRVSFKPPQFPHKKDVKLRMEDLRRWDEDDDMNEMTTAAKDRNALRRRGSPIPRGKFGKLMPNTFGWYQVTIHNGQMYEKDVLLRSLLAALSPHSFSAQFWRAERDSVFFYVDDFEVAERIQQLGKHATLPDGFRLSPRVRNGIPLVTVDDSLKERMKQVMAKRYNAQTKALDMSRFYADPDIKPVFCPLFRANVMGVALDIMCDNIPDLEALNLNDNNLVSMEAFRRVDKRLPHLKILYLGDNKLPSLAHLLVFRNLPIVELLLRNNPCRSRYKDSQHFVSEVRRKFPKLAKLDGESLGPVVAFDLAGAGTMPTTQASFLCDNGGADVVRQFLNQYFNIFDMESRQSLLDAYHEHAMLSITMPNAGHAGRLNNFWKFNRNFRRIVNHERDDHRTRLLKNGRLACVATLNEWPRTLHERRTFTVDLTIYNPQMIVFTVTGLFKELNGEDDRPSTSNAYELRHFMRTFVVVPQNSGFCIRNETIFITAATNEQVREFKRSQHQPAPGGATTAAGGGTTGSRMATAPASALQNRLGSVGGGATATVAILPEVGSLSLNALSSPTGVSQPQRPTAFASTGSATDEATKIQMVQAMSSQSQMNLEWSKKCLEETNWDYNHAGFVFEKLFKENKIPPEAFIK